MMRKTIFIFGVALLAACSKTEGDGAFVLDGTEWAASNVAEAGGFAARAETAGGRYTYEAAQTACPDGWRIPIDEEWLRLLALGSEWHTSGGVKGFVFSHGNGRLFFPAAGRLVDGRERSVGESGFYWSRPTVSGHWGLAGEGYVRMDHTTVGTRSGDVVYRPATDDDPAFGDIELSVRCVRSATNVK